MRKYSIALFVQELKSLAEKDKFLAEDLALHTTPATLDDVKKVEEKLGCRLPKTLVELMTTIDISGVQLGQIEFGTRPFSFTDALIEQNISTSDEDLAKVITDKGLLSVCECLDWTSPLCFRREELKGENDPPLFILDYYSSEIIGPVYDNFLACLEGQLYLMKSQHKPRTLTMEEALAGFAEIVGKPLGGSGKKYWDSIISNIKDNWND